MWDPMFYIYLEHLRLNTKHIVIWYTMLQVTCCPTVL
jgi:hypothetical protein